MPDRPLLILPSPGEPLSRRKKGSGNAKFNRPSRDRQAERLVPRFELLQQAFEARRARLRVEAHGIVPEEVVVLETVGTVDGFIHAVENVPGMEWLAEIDEEDIPPDDDFFTPSETGEARTGKALRGRLFVVFANQDALQQMLSLWIAWQSEEGLPRGLGRWKTLFQQLRDVRPWGVRDRLHETGVLQDWRERVEHGEGVVPCEIELWYRRTLQQRHAARDRVVALVESQEGRVVAETSIQEIAYHALLAHLPVEEVGRLLEQPNEDVALIQCEQIQFFRAGGQMSSFLPAPDQQEDREYLPEDGPAGAAVIALLDGLPLQAHRRLQGRLIVDDPDDFEQNYPSATRRHGTSMASLIVHGDLEAGEAPLTRPLYVRPILHPDPRDWRNNHETVPENTLVVDLVHRAVRRLFEGEGNEPPAAPEVTVINLSIGIRDRPFEQALSPLARLLDWLAWQYRVLFMVSAGNHVGRIQLSIPRHDLSSLTPEDLQRHVIRSVASEARFRRLLSPAEAINALTVASIHDDASAGRPSANWSTPYVTVGLPSPINAQGMGYRRGIKPEVLAAGGRVVVQEYLATTDRAELEIYQGTLAPGQLVAGPGRTSGDQSAVRYSRGTSNATALLSRAAGLIYEVLEELRDEPGGEIIDTIPRSVWIKALIAHGADWGVAGSTMDAILRDAGNSRQFKEYITRLLGYGVVDIDRVRECTARRATALSGGVLKKDESHVHRFPLPPSVSGRRGHRRLTISLGWLSPVNPRHQGWRRADLWFSPPMDLLRVSRQQADWRAVQRGTVQHEILDGSAAGVFVAGTDLKIQVSCRPDAGALEESVPYALVTTLEVAPKVGVEIYDEVRAAVHARVQVAPNV